MGGSSYSDDMYASRMASRRDYTAKAGAASAGAFTHHADVTTGKVSAKVHEKLDPAKPNTLGKLVRESLDSTEHPESRAIAVLFDVTGSMNSVPKLFLDKLGKLMALLVKKGYVEHPHILFGAIGDATCDKAPIQIGQFEAGNEMDEALSLIYLEGGGGGHNTESYELAMYYMSRHTVMDCFNKRGEKGFLFLMGDELPYSTVRKSQIAQHIGAAPQDDIPTEDILAELRDKFEVFWIIPAETNHANDRTVLDALQKMFGQNLLKLDNPADVCELIASTIGLSEGYDLDGIKSDLKDIGADAGSVDRAGKALVAYAGKAVTKGAVASAPLAVSGKDSVERL